jgi:hypothetical protein
VRLGIAALVVPALVFTGSSRVTAIGLLPDRNPAANATPSPNFEVSGPCTGQAGSWQCANPCVTPDLTFPAYSDAPSCVAFVQRALDAARAHEGLGAIVLPANWFSLSPEEQLFVLCDLERTARGLPPYLGLNAALSAAAQRAADTGSDPWLAPRFAVGVDHAGVPGFGGAWASGVTTLGADFLWMYADGWGGSAARTPNAACTSAQAAGCWAHRDELLGAAPRFNPGVGLGCRTCEMGTGFAVSGGTASFVDLVELPAGAAPTMTFTWAHDVVPYLPATGLAARAAAQRAAERRAQDARRAAVHGTWPQWIASSTAASPCRSPGRAAPLGAARCRTKTFKRAGR